MNERTTEIQELLAHLRYQLACVWCLDPVDSVCPTHGDLPQVVIDTVLSLLEEPVDA